MLTKGAFQRSNDGPGIADAKRGAGLEHGVLRSVLQPLTSKAWIWTGAGASGSTSCEDAGSQGPEAVWPNSARLARDREKGLLANNNTIHVHIRALSAHLAPKFRMPRSGLRASCSALPSRNPKHGPTHLDSSQTRPTAWSNPLGHFPNSGFGTMGPRLIARCLFGEVSADRACAPRNAPRAV